MHRKIATDAMAGAMVEILPGEPEIVACDGVKMLARYPFRPAQARNGDHALQDAGECGLCLRIDKPYGDRAGDVATIMDDQYEADKVKLDDQKVTVRDRDTMSQERIAIDALPGFLRDRLEGAE